MSGASAPHARVTLTIYSGYIDTGNKIVISGNQRTSIEPAAPVTKTYASQLSIEPILEQELKHRSRVQRSHLNQTPLFWITSLNQRQTGGSIGRVKLSLCAGRQPPISNSPLPLLSSTQDGRCRAVNCNPARINILKSSQNFCKLLTNASHSPHCDVNATFLMTSKNMTSLFDVIFHNIPGRGKVCNMPVQRFMYVHLRNDKIFLFHGGMKKKKTNHTSLNGSIQKCD